MGMMESLAQLREEAEAKLKSTQSPEELEQLLVDVLGRNGSLTTILRAMGKLESSERASVGADGVLVDSGLELVGGGDMHQIDRGGRGHLPDQLHRLPRQ